MNGADGTHDGPCLRHFRRTEKSKFQCRRHGRFIASEFIPWKDVRLKSRNFNAVGMVDLIASEFIPWKKGCGIFPNAIGMADFTMLFSPPMPWQT